MAKKARLLRVKRSPRYEGEGRGRNEGEGETRLIKRRPPPSANGPTAQELHAGNCCANTTTFILQPLGKRHILFNQERCCASLPPSFFLLAKESRFGFVSARIWNARWSRSFRRSKRSCDGTLDCGCKMQEERERKRKISTKIIFRQFRNSSGSNRLEIPVATSSMEDDKGCSLSPFTATLDRGRVAMDVNNGAATWIREIVDTQQRGNKDGGGFSLSLLPLSLPLSHAFHDREDRSWPQGSDHDKDGPFRKLLSSLLSKRATSSTRNPRYHEVKCHLKKLALSARERKIHEIRLLYANFSGRVYV